MYIGVTNDLKRRLREHKSEDIQGFTQKYHAHKLVYYEKYSSRSDAIRREKQLKKWRRVKKDLLVEKYNPDWIDWSQAFL